VPQPVIASVPAASKKEEAIRLSTDVRVLMASYPLQSRLASDLDSYRIRYPNARPIYRHKPDSIEAHLTIVIAALAVSCWIEEVTGWSVRKFVRTGRRYRTVEIQADAHTITVEPCPKKGAGSGRGHPRGPDSPSRGRLRAAARYELCGDPPPPCGPP
jgi:hypothetical protein